MAASLFAILFATFNGCSVVRKMNATKIILDTKMEYKDISLESVSLDPRIQEQVKQGLSGFVPNPQIVLLVQNIARGIINNELGKANLNVLINAKNNTKDTLWINSVQIDLKLDSLITLPVLVDNSVLLPGDNEMQLHAAFPLDMRLFQLKDVKTIAVAGVLNVSLEKGGTPVDLDFSIKHTIKPEEVKALENLARERLLQMLVNKWADAIIPKD